MSYTNYSRFDDEQIELGNDWGFYEDIEAATTYAPVIYKKDVIHIYKEDTNKSNIEKMLEKIKNINRNRDEQDAEVDRVSKYTNGLTRGVIMSAILISMFVLN
jgi:hypothetical protein